jgi:hypothetical protein
MKSQPPVLTLMLLMLSMRCSAQMLTRGEAKDYVGIRDTGRLESLS